MIALLFAAMLSQAADADEIVVTAQMLREEKAIIRQVAAVLPPSTSDQPLARFTGPVCPGVTGLSPRTAQAVVDRIGVIVNEVGLKVGAPGCDPNLLVIVAPDGRTTVRNIVNRRQGNVRAQTLADIRRIIAETGGARAWVEDEVRSRDGEQLTFEPGGPPSLSIAGASRAVLAFRRDIVSAIVVIDAAAVQGRDVVQIADYAAMRGLTDARPGKVPTDASILSAFAEGAKDSNAPLTLTPLDRGILGGLYSGQGNIPAAVKRAAIARRIVQGKKG